MWVVPEIVQSYYHFLPQGLIEKGVNIFLKGVNIFLDEAEEKVKYRLKVYFDLKFG